MDFLNVGPWELVVVLIIAILVAGPKRMVEIARTLGRVSRQLRDLSREFTTALQAEVQAAEQEAGAAGMDLHEVRNDLENVLAGSPQPKSEGADMSNGALAPGADEPAEHTDASEPDGVDEA